MGGGLLRKKQNKPRESTLARRCQTRRCQPIPPSSRKDQIPLRHRKSRATSSSRFASPAATRPLFWRWCAAAPRGALGPRTAPAPAPPPGRAKCSKPQPAGGWHSDRWWRCDCASGVRPHSLFSFLRGLTEIEKKMVQPRGKAKKGHFCDSFCIHTKP